jgi:multicomponent Na+:H+ antiporter subunit G
VTEAITLVLDLLSWFLILLGGAFGIIGGIGLLRLPDFFSRIHAASVTDSMCAPCIIAGLMLQSGLTLVTVKLAFLIVFLFLTSPTASHALAKAALHGGLHPGDDYAPGRSEDEAAAKGAAAAEGAQG